MKAFFRNVRDYINALRNSNPTPAVGAIAKSVQPANDDKRPIIIDEPKPLAEELGRLAKNIDGASKAFTPGEARITHSVSARPGNSHASV